MLPALPSAWPDGEVKGLRARGGFVVDLRWQNSRLTEADLRPAGGRTCRIRYGAKTAELTIEQPVRLSPELKVIGN